MVTIGDVFSVIGSLVGICVTAWAVIMGAALLFQSSASRARDAYRSGPWKGIGLGLLLTLVFGTIGFILVNIPNPAIKLTGMGVLLAIMVLSALGASGISMLIAERIAALDPNASRYGAMQRATLIMVVAGVFPILGWFLIGPLLIIAGVGYGIQALVATVRYSAVQGF
ncbi:MAG TPA: hypothetical protein VGL56_07545 [Fimbriimonadaceae bacterium]|jgi:hypothetical protein